MQQRLLMNLDQVSFARSIPLFAGLSEAEKDLLLDGGSIYAYGKKETLFRQGDPVRYFYLVCDGLVQELRQTEDGREITANLHMVGDTLGKIEMFLPSPVHHTTAIVAEDSFIMELPLEAFKERVLRNPAVMKAMLSSLAQLAHAKQMEVEQQATMTATQIVASYLRQLCATLGLDARGFTLPFKKSMIASRLGMELETFSRTLPKLKDHGITVKGTQVSIAPLGESALANPPRRPADVIPFPAKKPPIQRAWAIYR